MLMPLGLPVWHTQARTPAPPPTPPTGYLCATPPHDAGLGPVGFHTCAPPREACAPFAPSRRTMPSWAPVHSAGSRGPTMLAPVSLGPWPQPNHLSARARPWHPAPSHTTCHPGKCLPFLCLVLHQLPPTLTPPTGWALHHGKGRIFGLARAPHVRTYVKEPSPVGQDRKG